MNTRGLTGIVNEGKHAFKVNLSDYLDTGLFLDRRLMRRMVGGDSAGKRILNLFCYTGAFSVYAASGGAVSTDSVDLSNTYLGWAQENFALNGIKAEILRLEDFFASPGKRPAHKLIRADVSVFLKRAQAARLRWDSIIVDPPAFSNSTMARADFDLLRDYSGLLNSCLALLNPGGTIWFSAAARSFKAAAGELEAALAAHYPCVKVTDITGKTTDEDFKGKKVPKAFVVTIL
jgi:23S rRNA (cytosine1962-C5)-methyltransferase